MQVKDYQKQPKNYSITELEMCSLAIIIASFAHLLKRVDFDAIVEPLSLDTHNQKQSKTDYHQNKKVVRNIKLLLI